MVPHCQPLMHCTVNTGNYAGNSHELRNNTVYCCSFNVLIGKNVLQKVKKDLISPIGDSLETIASSIEEDSVGTVEDPLLELSLLQRNLLLSCQKLKVLDNVLGQ